MNRLPITVVEIGDSKRRYRAIIHSDECPPAGQTCRYLQYELLRELASNPDMSKLGMEDFQSLKMFHDGNKWVVELEAVIKGVKN